MMPGNGPAIPCRKASEILADPATSYWLRDALRTALLRDPGDAALDAMMLHEVLSQRFDDCLAGPLVAAFD